MTDDGILIANPQLHLCPFSCYNREISATTVHEIVLNL